MARATVLGKELAVRGTEGGRSPTGVPPTAAGSGASAPDAPAAAEAKPIPDPAVPEKPVRRWFTAEYKLRVLREADRCPQPGQLEALLRREGLYSSHLSTWRQQRDQGPWPGWLPIGRAGSQASRAASPRPTIPWSGRTSGCGVKTSGWPKSFARPKR